MNAEGTGENNRHSVLNFWYSNLALRILVQENWQRGIKPGSRRIRFELSKKQIFLK